MVGTELGIQSYTTKCVSIAIIKQGTTSIILLILETFTKVKLISCKTERRREERTCCPTIYLSG